MAFSLWMLYEMYRILNTQLASVAPYQAAIASQEIFHSLHIQHLPDAVHPSLQSYHVLIPVRDSGISFH